jgi:hypothetical protein
METQQSVSQWSTTNFGPATSNLRIAIRASEEMNELLGAISSQKSAEEIIEKAADVAIVMYQYTQNIRMEIDTSVLSRKDPYGVEYLAAQANTKLAAIISMLAIADNDRYTSYSVHQLYYFLEQVCAKLEGNLQDAIDKKMVANRARDWRTEKDNVGYHVPLEEELSQAIESFRSIEKRQTTRHEKSLPQEELSIDFSTIV